MIQVPDGWEINNFKDLKIKLIDGDRGENYPKENEFSDNGFCVFLSAKNVTKDGFRFNEIQFIEKDKDEKLRKGKLNKNDIVLTTRGTVGNIAYFDNTIKYNHIRINSGMILLRNENKTLETNYLHIFLKSNIFDNQISNTVFGSAQPQLTVKEIEKFFICFPKEKKEQEKIAKILSTLDNAIESTTRIIEKEKNIKTALMQELLTNGIDKNGQIRTPQTHTYKQSELGLIPDEWEVDKINEVTKLMTDFVANGSFESLANNVTVFESPDFAYYVRLVDIRKGLGHEKQTYVNEQSFNFLKKSSLTGREILIANIGANVGETFLMPILKKPATIAPNMIVIKVNSKIIPEFLFYFLTFHKGISELQNVTEGSGQPKINKTKLKTINIIIPLIKEQEKIIKILNIQDKRIEMENKTLAKLKELKKGLMNDLLSGKVRVNV